MNLQKVISFVFLFVALFGHSQTQISGVVNNYSEVTAVNYSLGQMDVVSTAGLNIGDTVLIIQMKGADIKETDLSISHGKVDNYNSAGKYELNEICEIAGNTITFTKMFVNHYSADGVVQLVTVPYYTDAEVVAPIMAQPWDGATGGIVALNVANTLALNADIDVSEQGFVGGGYFASPFNCTFLDNLNEYDYVTGTGYGAKKGEGIARHGSKDGGRGPLANGGGGGNDHNSGGGGGSNISKGGNGGDNDDPGQYTCKGFHPGIGGRSLDYTDNRLFLGGGGGAGHANNTGPSDGGNGGGLVLIRAGSIEGNGKTIRANGQDGKFGYSDGAGGGGAGGTIALEVQNLNGSLFLETIGGKGGDTDNFTGDRCFGPGGGGAGGFVWTSQAIPGNVTMYLSAGTNGIVTNSSNGCNGSAQNAEPGEDGNSDTGLEIPISEKGNAECNKVTQIDLGPDAFMCEGDELILDPGAAGVSYEWSTGETTSTITVNSSGEYWVHMDDGSCIVCDTIQVSFDSYPNDVLNDEEILCDGKPVVLNAGNFNVNYLWSTGETTKKIEVTEPGTYSVIITNGVCSVEDSTKVIKCPTIIFIPNLITPNGDGDNDTWIISALYEFPNNEVEIFDRNGNRIFKMKAYDNSWDGGSIPAGTYYYSVNLNEPGGKPQTGTITIVRE